MSFYTSLYALVIFIKFKYGSWKKVPGLNRAPLDNNEGRPSVNLQPDALQSRTVAGNLTQKHNRKGHKENAEFAKEI